MKASEVIASRRAYEFLNYPLTDKIGYTLKDFLIDMIDPESDEQLQDYYDASMADINGLLKDNGIDPIPYRFDSERDKFRSVMQTVLLQDIHLANIVASEGHSNRVSSIIKNCNNFVNTYDFDVTFSDGKYTIDMSLNDMFRTCIKHLFVAINESNKSQEQLSYSAKEDTEMELE